MRESWLSPSRINTSKVITPTFQLVIWVGNFPTHIYLLYQVLFRLGVAVSAVNRFVAARLEGNFCLFAAASAGGRIHLARASIAVTAAFVAETLSPSGCSTRRTALGFISEAFGCKELLLFDRKGERFSAIATGEGFF
jgi:hypothetical protein